MFNIKSTLYRKQPLRIKKLYKTKLLTGSIPTITHFKFWFKFTQNKDLDLMTSAKRGNFKVFKFLINEGDYLKHNIDYIGRDILLIASSNNKDKIVKYINDNEIINKNQVINQTPLMYAAYFNNLELMKYLISKGADVNKKCSNGDAVIFYAQNFDYLKTIKLLVENGADINVKNCMGETLLERAKYENYLDLVEYIECVNK